MDFKNKKTIRDDLSLAEEQIGITASTGEGLVKKATGIYALVIVALGVS